MQRTAVAPFSSRFPQGVAHAWLARRWYYSAKTHRPYSVRQIAPGDRRLLAEFSLCLSRAAPEREVAVLQEVATLLFDHVIGASQDGAMGFAALENTSAGDRVIGICAYALSESDCADFSVAVANSYRDEQVGRTLLSTMVRHAKRVGVPRLVGRMSWSNRPMQVLAISTGFAIEPVAGDRNQRRLSLALK